MVVGILIVGTSAVGCAASSRCEVTAASGLEDLMQSVRESSVPNEQVTADFFAATVTPQSAFAMLEIFEETPRDEVSDIMFLEFLYAWGKTAGPEAVTIVMDSYATAQIGSRWRTGLDADMIDGSSVQNFAAGWASADLAAAMQYTAKLDDDGETWTSNWMHLGILRHLQRTNLNEAIAYSQQFYMDTLESFRPDGPFSAHQEEKFRGLDSIMAAIEEQQGLAILERWVEGIDDEVPAMQAYKREATSRMLEVMRSVSPERAAAWQADNTAE